MAFNGSGVFQRVRNWVADATAGVKIRADFHDAEDDGFAAGLTNCITKDGQTIVTQNIPWNSKRITGLADPVNPQDASTKAYTDTKMPLAGGTITGDLVVTGGVTANGYMGRAGTGGVIDGWLHNLNHVGGSGTLEMWVNTVNLGAIATQAYVNGQVSTLQGTDTSLQNQINGKQASLGFTPVQQGGGTGMAGNKVYIGWDGAGLRHQVDNNDTFMYLVRGPNPSIGTVVADARLAHAGDIAVATGPQGSMYEPWGGAVITGWSWLIVGGIATTGSYRFRYMQIKTTGGFFTVAYA